MGDVATFIILLLPLQNLLPVLCLLVSALHHSIHSLRQQHEEYGRYANAYCERLYSRVIVHA